MVPRAGYMPVQLGTRPNPRHCKPVERGPPALGGGIRVNHSVPGDLFQGHSCPKEWKVWPRGEGLAAGWSDLDPQRAALPRPPRDSAMEPVLKRSHMEQPQRCDRRCSRHMPQEPPKLVSVVPPSCSWTYLSSSTPTERVPAWGALSDWPNPNSILRKGILCIDKSLLFSQLTRRPNWLRCESTNPCVRITDPKTEPVWDSRRGSWECARPVLSREQGLPPLLSWRHGAIGTAWRAGPVLICSSFERKPQEWPVARKDRHMEVRVFRSMLQTELGDGCIRRRGSAWASWKEAYERPSSRCADPRLVATHRFSWAQWSKGWKTLPSYRLEGPVPSRPSPVGQRFLSQVMGIGCLHCCEVDSPELGRTPGELNRIAESDGP